MAPCPPCSSCTAAPPAADEDCYDATRAAWLDAGFAVVQVNYRGSTGYGSAWRDALTERIGHTELADVAAVHDHLVATRHRGRRRRSVVAGGSWGGFLTLLAPRHPTGQVGGRGRRPSRSPTTCRPTRTRWNRCAPMTAHCSAARPEDRPDAYRDSSPLTYVDRGPRPGADPGRRERPALPYPARSTPTSTRWPSEAPTTRCTASTRATARWSSTSGSARWPARSLSLAVLSTASR